MEGSPMKTLAIRQPWATLIAEGTKTIEVRTWRTVYRGPLLIVASGEPYHLLDVDRNSLTLPTQCQVCTVDLIDCRPLTPGDFAAACVPDSDPDAAPGYFAWELANPRHVAPVPHLGKLSLYRTPEGCIYLPGDVHYLDWTPF